MRFTHSEEMAILSRGGMTSILSSEVLADLRRRYSEPHRHYHDWNHALSVLSWVNHVCDAFPERVLGAYTHQALRTAALFHDAVYDFEKDPSSEERSAQLLNHTGSMPESYAVGLVRATEFHGSADGREMSLAVQLFMDCDMVSIAEPIWEVCFENNVNIEIEYRQHYTAEQVAIGRREFLQKMLAKRSVFLSDYFRVRYEVLARDNIRRLIALIETREELSHGADQSR